MQIKSKRLAVTAAIAGACVAAAVLAPTASGAATGYTVSKGGAVKAANSGKLVFEDVTSNSKPKLTCTKFTGSGTAVKGAHKFVPKKYTGKSLNAAGSLSKQSLTGCSNPQAGDTTVKTSGTWSLGFSSKSKTGGSGYLYGVTANLSAGIKGVGKCTFTSKGVVYGTYANKGGVFTGTSTPGLVLSKVTGNLCSIVGIANGDKAILMGKVKLTPALTIK